MTLSEILPALAQDQLLSPEQRKRLQDDPPATAADLCSRLEDQGVSRDDIVGCLARQTRRTAERVRLSRVGHQPEALAYLTAGDAWDYLVLPLQIEPDGRLLCCTTGETLATSLDFLLRTLDLPFRLVLSDVGPLEMYIAEQYHYEGLDVDAA